MSLDAFLDLRPQITGECTVASHKAWIELTAFEYGLGDASGPEDLAEQIEEAEGDPQKIKELLSGRQKQKEGKFRSVSFSKFVDRASPLLFKFCALYNTADKAGTPLLPKAIVHLCRYAGQKDQSNYVTYGQLQFEGCNIQSVTLRVGDNGVTTEDVQMSYEKVSFIYTETAEGGGAKASAKTRFSWDVHLNKEWSGAPQ